MSDQARGAKLVTDEVFDRIIRESARLYRRRAEMQQAESALSSQQSDVKKQSALLEKVKHDFRGKSAEILSREAAANNEDRLLSLREREVAQRELAAARREEDFAELESELKETREELEKVKRTHDEQLGAYQELEEKYQHTRQAAGHLEVNQRLSKFERTRDEKQANSVASQLDHERGRNRDLIMKNAELTERLAHYRGELQRLRGTSPDSATPIASVATTTEPDPATDRPAGPFPDLPVYARSTIASRARAPISPTASSTMASSAGGKNRGFRNDGMSTSCETASPAVHLPSGALPEDDESSARSASPLTSSVSTLNPQGRQTRRKHHQSLCSRQSQGPEKLTSYEIKSVAAVVRNPSRGKELARKSAASEAPSKGFKASTSEPALTARATSTIKAKSSSTARGTGNGPSPPKSHYAFSAGSTPLGANASTPKAFTARKRELSHDLKASIRNRFPAPTLHREATGEEDVDASVWLDSTVISDGIDIPDLGLAGRQSDHGTRGGMTASNQVPTLGSPIGFDKIAVPNFARADNDRAGLKGWRAAGEEQQSRENKDEPVSETTNAPPALNVLKRQTAPRAPGMAPSSKAPALDSPIDHARMTKWINASQGADNKGKKSKQAAVLNKPEGKQEKNEKNVKEEAGQGYKIKSKAFV